MSAADVLTGYTPVPNSFFELAAQLSEAELRVMLALTRLITGYNADEKPLSLSDLGRATGLSRQGVVGGVKRLRERGCILTRIQGDNHTTVFHIPTSQPSRLVNEVDQSTKLTSQPSRLPATGESQSTKLTSQPSRLVNEVDPLYIRKDLKESAAAAVDRTREGEAEHDQFMDEAHELATQGVSSPPFSAPPVTAPDEVFAVYQDNIGQVTPMISEQVKGAVEDYGAAWVIEAIRAAVTREKRSWAYVNGTLAGWKRDGRSGPIAPGATAPPAPASTLRKPDPNCPVCKGSGHAGNFTDGFEVCACRKGGDHARAS